MVIERNHSKLMRGKAQLIIYESKLSAGFYLGISVKIRSGDWRRTSKAPFCHPEPVEASQRLITLWVGSLV
ncbi:MAG: hypothetical protein A2295_02585 [Candidatus Jacksonbacteria bacterium RIFOXYB2_FULL_44_15]|nr:MAG: hypothetical protein A2295_02585 [Candidatus Jacksonbacteria bacterium RIFOXYB2_FULL_44_15]OGY79906.1 MAG: hypothetical protein A2550_06360 [Candidatus Jacksonbacteria bacterium RIFOXYD2_FULL_43_21]HCC49775.1 hypothetical protein [Candidatus Jacksonbacteria bacterium]HCE49489.1 hypothetical protein [Candidatus Jacksonbacteria bacterium]